MGDRFFIRYEPEVEIFVATLAPVPQRQVTRDLEKLATRGLSALPPLTGHIEGPIWELRSKVDGYGLYRIFYYRDGLTSFHAFYPYQKKDERLPARVRAEVLKRYEELTGKKP
jgi:phage-related protein